MVMASLVRGIRHWAEAVALAAQYVSRLLTLRRITMTDAVYLGTLSRETRRAIDNYLVGKDRLEMAERSWVQFENVCALWFELKHEPDTEELFPKGKWATLQKLESLIDDAIKADRSTTTAAGSKDGEPTGEQRE